MRGRRNKNMEKKTVPMVFSVSKAGTVVRRRITPDRLPECVCRATGMSHAMAATPLGSTRVVYTTSRERGVLMSAPLQLPLHAYSVVCSWSCLLQDGGQGRQAATGTTGKVGNRQERTWRRRGVEECPSVMQMQARRKLEEMMSD